MNFMTWKMPPKTKIYEALSAVADGRVTITGSTSAQVMSSSKDKTYDVEWSVDMNEITSNDNASYWQGYIGYPIVAVLLQVGRIQFDAKAAQCLAGVHWKDINDRFKRDYEKAVQFVLQQLDDNCRDIVTEEVVRIYDRLASLELKHLQQRKAKVPPKGR